ncbi:alpha-amylase [Metabacillus arenae]|uniref:Alpha-amylase n=1 Tax=Metabacillus arenae TaxID=2771434 RepID=A0A926NER9_9BACI|nr:alpha-amylase [Metabacillus arenae]MBD1379780.1 alpha-amylase [Metabacillus arenae]
MERNHTIMQFFEWHIKSDGAHWHRLMELAPELKERGIDSVWIPPVTKAENTDDPGYGIYDLYDLGEFDQKGEVRTKYGVKEDLHKAISACKEHGINVYVDIVMNHKAGADEKETFQVIEVDPNNRDNDLSKPYEIEGWTKFTFPARGKRYSSFQWNFNHFNGVDYDARHDRKGVFRIVGDNKGWNDPVDSEFGNYDYLMFANIDYNHPAVRGEMLYWGWWLANTLDCNGFRMDAIKHINYDFIEEFVDNMAKKFGKDFYFIGEFWKPDLKSCQDFLEHIEYKIDLFDVGLHYNLEAASKTGRDYDLTTIFDGTLVKSHPLNAVTFVDNHDTQPNGSLNSWVGDWFKQSAYALILLRKDGYPCVFYGDYYGISGDEPIDSKKEAIDPLLYARYHKAYGDQEDYFDHPNTIGWVRRGVSEIERSGCAVVISNGDEGGKEMFVGEARAGEVWVDLTNTRKDHIIIEKDGHAFFPVNKESVSVWALPEEDLEK